MASVFMRLVRRRPDVIDEEEIGQVLGQMVSPSRSECRARMISCEGSLRPIRSSLDDALERMNDVSVHA